MKPKIRKVKSKDLRIENEFQNELLKRGELFAKSSIDDIARNYTQQYFSNSLKKLVLLITNRLRPVPHQDLIEYISLTSRLLSGDQIEPSKFFRNHSPEQIREFFEQDKHIDMFEAVHEISFAGSGVDLAELCSYGFLGFLNGGYFGWRPWLLVNPGDQEYPFSPKHYISLLIKNCEAFIDTQNPVFNQALIFARARYSLDFENEIDANDFAIFCGRDIRTLVNNGLLETKTHNQPRKVSTENAINFLVHKIRPDKTEVKKDKIQEKIGFGLTDPFPQTFYDSIWKDQVKFQTSLAWEWELDEDGDHYIELTKMDCFISDSGGSPIRGYKKMISEFPSNVAPHNRERVEWIGSGKTFNELNQRDSIYRNNIKRLSYSGNTSSIEQDIKYDLKKGWIKEV